MIDILYTIIIYPIIRIFELTYFQAPDYVPAIPATNRGNSIFSKEVTYHRKEK